MKQHIMVTKEWIWLKFEAEQFRNSSSTQQSYARSTHRSSVTEVNRASPSLLDQNWYLTYGPCLSYMWYVCVIAELYSMISYEGTVLIYLVCYAVICEQY